jgi:hypothetical protein
MQAKPILRINFATGTLGCGSIALLLLALFSIWMIGFADLSESQGRRVDIIRMLQTIRIAGIPVGAVLIGGCLAFQAFIWAWRWTDQVALGLSGERLHFHRSVKRKSIQLDELESISVTYRGTVWVKTLNPSLVIKWTDGDTRMRKTRLIRNINLEASDTKAFRERLLSMGKWNDEGQTS